MQLFCIFLQNNKFKMGLKKDSPKNNGAPPAKPYFVRVCWGRGAFSLSCLSVIQKIFIFIFFEKSQKNTFIDARRRSVREFYPKIENDIDQMQKNAKYSVWGVLFFSIFV